MLIDERKYLKFGAIIDPEIKIIKPDSLLY
jgi:hypothetical protein